MTDLDRPLCLADRLLSEFLCLSEACLKVSQGYARHAEVRGATDPSFALAHHTVLAQGRSRLRDGPWLSICAQCGAPANDASPPTRPARAQPAAGGWAFAFLPLSSHSAPSTHRLTSLASLSLLLSICASALSPSSPPSASLPRRASRRACRPASPTTSPAAAACVRVQPPPMLTTCLVVGNGRELFVPQRKTAERLPIC